ncbi:XRE family transcriptional regulator [Sphingomonas sanxanigenens]|uniref:XRE family transcriptional regulator n=1 Tax=Sphingomonas sanxanigenens TaxID=397260 RepID=UPI00046CD97E|nr:S24 family peptidase [Sphingomonas sanxanigenens]
MLAENIKRLRGHLGLNQGAFADQLDVSQPDVSKWESRGVEPAASRLGLMAKLANVSVLAFMNEAWSPPAASAPRPDIPPVKGAADEDGPVYLTRIEMAYAMGPGSSLEDFPETGQLQFDPNVLRTITRSPPERLYVASGEGDSMMPTLLDSDMVLIDTLQRQLNQQDRIWACSIHGAGAIKRLRTIGRTRVLVISDNPNVENQEVDAEDLYIFGRIIWVGRRV